MKASLNYWEVKKFLLEQMEGELDDSHLTRVKIIEQFWDKNENDESIIA